MSAPTEVVVEPCHMLDDAGKTYCGERVTRESHTFFDCVLLGHERCPKCVKVALEREKPLEPRVLVEVPSAS